MPYLSGVIIRARYATRQAIKDLIEAGRAKNEKDALMYIVNQARQKGLCCGYSTSESDYRIYCQYKAFKNRIKYYQNDKKD